MRSRTRDQKGITVVALVITVAVLIILTTTMVIGISSRYESQRLDKLSSDLKLLKDKVLIYYSENGNYPIIEETLQEESKYEIDLSKLDGLTLNYGNSGEDDEVYLIDITTGEISYKKGIEYKGQRYYKILDEQIDDATASDVLKITNYQVTIKDGSGNEVAQKEQVLNKSHIISIYNRETVSITANVNVSDLDEIVYEWYRNDKLISGASTQTYEISEPENNDTYYCKVTYNGASKNSTKFIIRNDRKIPNNYQEVEYIKGTTGKYINTEENCKGTSKIDITYAFTISTNAYKIPIGAWANATTSSIALGCDNTNSLAYRYASGFNTFSNYKLSPNNPYNIKFSYSDGLYLDSKLVETVNKKDFTTEIPFYLFAINENGNPGFAYSAGNMCIYDCKIYDGDILKRNFIPCYRISDNVIGMYDTVGNKFYTNAGTGTFVKGNEVN